MHIPIVFFFTKMIKHKILLDVSFVSIYLNVVKTYQHLQNLSKCHFGAVTGNSGLGVCLSWPLSSRQLPPRLGDGLSQAIGEGAAYNALRHLLACRMRSVSTIPSGAGRGAGGGDGTDSGTGRKRTGSLWGLCIMPSR